jgi:hypothetical protein
MSHVVTTSSALVCLGPAGNSALEANTSLDEVQQPTRSTYAQERRQ